MVKVQDNQGPVLSHIDLQPIFWGPEWSSNPYSNAASSMVTSLRQLLAGPYLRGLSQYRGISGGTVRAGLFVGAEPPPPAVSDNDLLSLIKGLVNSGQAPDFKSNPQIFYLVLTPDGHSSAAHPSASGYHNFDPQNTAMRYALVVWSPGYPTEDWVYIATHEIVEACSDPLPFSGFVAPVNGQIQEIADVCQPKHDTSDGVVAAAYWSNTDAACIVPKRVVRLKLVVDDCGVGAVGGNVSRIDTSIDVDPGWIDKMNLPPLLYPTYQWDFDPGSCVVLGPHDRESLHVQWTAGFVSTAFEVTVLDSNGITMTGSLTVSEQNAADAEMIAKICRLRKLLTEVFLRVPWFRVPIGDPAPVPSSAEIELLNSMAKQLNQIVSEITQLDKKRLERTRGAN
jgi:hypothetical protein